MIALILTINFFTAMKTKLSPFCSIINRGAVFGALLLALSGGATVPLHAQTSLFYDFENFSDGSVIGQQGWSGGGTPGLLSIDPYTPSEQVVSTTAYSGNNSWQYVSGIPSGYAFGAGTPYTPNLGLSMQIGSVFTGSFRFLPSVASDGSWMEIDTGNPGGDDRAEFIGYINNYASATDFGPGLSISTVGLDDVEYTLFSGLDPNAWHLLQFSVLRTGTDSNMVSVSVDESAPVTFSGVLAAYRQDNSFSYADSSRLKFSASKTASGFYIDDVSYSIPEPSVSALIAGMAMLGLGLVRKKRRG